MEGQDPINPQPLIAAAIAAKIARIEWLAADNAEDLHPSFVRLLAESMERKP